MLEFVHGCLQIKTRESVWTYLGDASYSLYLSHTLILLALLGLWQKLPMAPDLIILTGILASLLFAWRVHELFERPIMLWVKRQRFDLRKSLRPIISSLPKLDRRTSNIELGSHREI